MSAEIIRERLRENGAKRDGDNWQCPAHEDRAPSLSVAERDGKPLVHCHAGCTSDDVLAALGLTWRDVLDDGEGPKDGRAIEAAYPYTDERGELLFEAVRFIPKDFRQRRPDGAGGWVWKLGDVRRVLYRLPQVLEAVTAGRTVWVVEGEKDVHAFERAGEVATCNPMGAGKWRDEYAETLRGANVVIVRDQDDPGREHAEKVRQSLAGVAASVTAMDPKTGKDAADHLGAGHGVVDFMPAPTAEASSAAADPWQPHPLQSDAPAPPAADLLPVANSGLLYSGQHHVISGPTGAWKSWIGLWGAAHVVRSGGVVWWFDWEMTEPAAAYRAQLLGLTPDEWSGRFYYQRPSGAITPARMHALISGAPDLRLVVVDSYSSVIGAFGGGSNDRDAVEAVYASVFEPLKARGVASLVTDHVNKNPENRGQYSTGSPRKVELADVHIGVQVTGSRPVRVAVTKWKDRPHGIFPGFADGTKIGHLEIANAPNPITILFHAQPSVPDESDPNRSPYYRPTTLMARVSEWMHDHPGWHSVNAVRAGVTGKNDAKQHALTALAAEGFIETKQDGQAVLNQHARRFDSAADSIAGGNEWRRPDPTAPTAPYRAPTAPGAGDQTYRAHRAPPYTKGMAGEGAVGGTEGEQEQADHAPTAETEQTAFGEVGPDADDWRSELPDDVDPDARQAGEE